jgi:hypothetical protein
MRFKATKLVGTLSLSCLLSGATTWAGWPEFRQQCHTDKLRNNAWPQPFRAIDANATVSPFEIMKNNGWREFNTLSTAFFDNSNQLTDAGSLKLKQVLTQSPPTQRSVYVLKAATPEQTAVRVEAVQVAVSGMIPVGELPPILLTDIEPATSSGAYQTVVNRALIKTTPSPRLPNTTDQNAPPQQTVAPGAGQGGSSTGK